MCTNLAIVWGPHIIEIGDLMVINPFGTGKKIMVSTAASLVSSRITRCPSKSHNDQEISVASIKDEF